MIDPIADNNEITALDDTVQGIMDVAHDKHVVAPVKKPAACECGKVVGRVLLPASGSSLALAGYMTGDGKHHVGVDGFCHLYDGAVSDNGAEHPVPKIVGDRHVAVRASDLSSLRFEEKIVVVDPDPQIVGEKTAGPVVVVATQEVKLDAPGLAGGDCMEDIEVVTWDDRGVFPVEIKNVAEEEDGRAIGHPAGKRNKPFSSRGFTGLRSVAKMGVCDKKDVWRQNLNNIGHRSV